MSNPTDPLNYLDPINFGTGNGKAEDDTTLGTDRIDVRVPPDQNRISGLQITRLKEYIEAESAFLKGGNGLRILPAASNPFSSSECGIFIDSVSNILKQSVLGVISPVAGSGTTLNTIYSSNPSDNLIALSSAGQTVILRDAASPIAESLFSIQNETGSTKFFDVASTGITTDVKNVDVKSSDSDGASAVSLTVDTVSSWSSGKLASFKTAGSEVAFVKSNGDISTISKVLTDAVQPYSGPITITGHSTGGTKLLGEMASGSSSVSTIIDTGSLWSAGKLLSARNNGSEKAYIDYSGALNASALTATGALSANSASITNALSAASANITGNITAASATVNSQSLTLPYGFINYSDNIATITNQQTTTFANVFPSWTVTVPVSKTYTLHVDLTFYQNNSTGGTYFQTLLDGSTTNVTNPTNGMSLSIPANQLNMRIPMSWRQAIYMTAGSHTIQLQWKSSSTSVDSSVNTSDHCLFTLMG